MKKAAHRLTNVDKVATLPERTAETLAQQQEVSERTIVRDGKWAEGASVSKGSALNALLGLLNEHDFVGP